MAGVPDFFDVAGPHALLGRGEAAVLGGGGASEKRLELHHARAIEQERLIQPTGDVVGDERPRRKSGVAFRVKELKILAAQFAGGHRQTSNEAKGYPEVGGLPVILGVMVSLLVVGMAALVVQDGPNPHQLRADQFGKLDLSYGITEAATGKQVTATDVAKALRGTSVLCLGESHDNRDQKVVFAEVIDALVKDGRTVTVGFEMFTRPVQPELDWLNANPSTDDVFVERSKWKTEWGFPFEVYKPVFDVTRANRLPMVALNIPRDWVRAVSRGGLQNLNADFRAQMPEIDTSNTFHREIFDAMMGGHPMGDATQMQNIYTSMVVWDTAMADSAKKWMDARPKFARQIFVVVAGSGHVQYGQGINFQLNRLGVKNIKTLTSVDSNGPTWVSKGLGDWVLLTKPAPAPAK